MAHAPAFRPVAPTTHGGPRASLGPVIGLPAAAAIALFGAACASEVVAFGAFGAGGAGGAGEGGAGAGDQLSASSVGGTTTAGGNSSSNGGTSGQGGSCACASSEDCPAPPGFCAVAACDACACTVVPAKEGTSCGSQGETCSAGGACVSGLGAACSAAEECASGYCADGVCCGEACDGACVSCALAGRAGSCELVDAGTPDASCPGGSCDDFGVCASGAQLLAKPLGGQGSELPTAVAVDAAGNVIVVGTFQTTLSLEGTTAQGKGGSDVFVASYGKAGGLNWVKTAGGAQDDVVHSVAVDSGNNVVFCGSFQGTADFGGGALTSAGSTDAYVVKLGPTGNHVFSFRYGDFFGQTARAVAIGASDDVVLGGHFASSIDFGGGALTSAGSTDLYVATLSSAGQQLFAKRIGNFQQQELYGLALDPLTGDIAATGRSFGTLTVAGKSLVTSGGGDVYVLSLDAAGNELWGRVFGDGQEQFGRGVAVDANGDVLVHGYFTGAVDFGMGAKASLGSSDLFLAKLDPLTSGTTLWAKTFGNAGEQVARSIAVDSSDAIVVTGYATGDLDFGGGLVKNAGQSDVYLAKFTSEGTHLFSHFHGSGVNQYGYAVAVDPATDELATVGAFFGTIDFGGGVLTASNGQDGYVAKLSP